MGKGTNSDIVVEEETVSSSKTKDEKSSTNFSNKETLITWKQVDEHATKTDCWIVYNECVYDLTKFKLKHPGGSKLIDNFAGQDATVRLFF